MSNARLSSLLKYKCFSLRLLILLKYNFVTVCSLSDSFYLAIPNNFLVISPTGMNIILVY